MVLKKILLSILLLICIYPAMSEITYSGILAYYNLGENIKTDISITSAENFNGFFTSSIDCEGFTSSYYTTPYKITANQITKISMPELEAFNYMKGLCSITWKLVDRDNKIVDEKISPKFNVTDVMNIDLGEIKNVLLPSENLKISGKMRNVRGEETFGTMEVFFNGDSEKHEIRAGNIDTTVKVPATIKSGLNTLGLIFYDQKGNKQTSQLELHITALATKVKISIDNRSYKPYETLSGEIRLLDQAGAEMNGTIQISLRRIVLTEEANVDVIVSKDAEPGSIRINIDNLYEPGSYLIIGSHGAIASQEQFDIMDLNKIEYIVDGTQVIIKNSGNIKYISEDSIDASSQKFSKKLVEEVDLRPGESKTIDLSKELRNGEYTIILPNGEKADAVKIDDKRGILTKTTDGISALTGFASKDIKNSFGSLSIAILIILVVLGIAIYAKRALYDKDDDEADEETDGKVNPDDDTVDVSYMLDGNKAAKPIKKKNTVDVFGAKDEQDSELQDDIIPAKAENKILKQKIDQLEKDNAELRGKVQMIERANRITQESAKQQNSRRY